MEFLTGLLIAAACGVGYLLWSHGRLTGIVATLKEHKVVPVVAALGLKADPAVATVDPTWVSATETTTTMGKP